MKIVIITRGRVGNISTIEWIPPVYLKDTFILCPYFEVQAHQHNHPGITVLPEADIALNYSQKFDRIVNGSYPELGRKIVIMDDDLKFSMRLDGSTKLMTADWKAMNKAFKVLERMLDFYPLAGLHPRALGNNAAPGIKEIARVNALQAVNLDMIGPMRLDYWPVLADIVLALKLLSRGQKTALYCDVFWDQVRGSNAEGGCSLYRTPEVQEQAVLGLHEMFPHYVHVVKKQTKGGWFGKDVPRTDFTIYWNRAWNHGRAQAEKEEENARQTEHV